jgi:acetyl-CoA decarbonylase/synthase complex subunit gamma
MLLPYIPVRSFALKGFLLGLFISFILFLNNLLGNNVIQIAAWFVFFPAFASFFAMNFTGASTFTSLSGVKKEMKYAVPLQIASIAVSCILIIIKTII